MERIKKSIAEGHTSGAAELYRAICQDAAENVDANLVSIWRFDDHLSKITCLFSLDIAKGDSGSGQELLRSDFPRYFETILEEATISAPDACIHSQTKELCKVYFQPNQIVSLLNFIVHRDFKPIGVICCESKGKRRDWSEANRKYLRSLATFASFKTAV